ncbi:hypothetical protein [Wenxinia saemankumensis]|uniref:Uncharacterized protein n=1 Tax=Wenxinia saemankumensis TaxID=1447782 RepID=A0A1M6A558_9RHOB|nr:hypothetical protein [Wenxinia saemankumensis]SHI31631.1 hypothetical protein SAMN05444417_0234 [Wenxinia saemankumensis]
MTDDAATAVTLPEPERRHFAGLTLRGYSLDLAQAGAAAIPAL